MWPTPIYLSTQSSDMLTANRVQDPENSIVWHQQVLGWLNRYSGVEAGNAQAVSLDDTTVEVVNNNP